MPDIAVVCFALAVFMATLLPLLLLTRPSPDEFDGFAEEIPDEPIRYDHPLILDYFWPAPVGR